MERLLITICGRAGSKGFKNKNLKTFCGHPLVYYSLSAAELFLKSRPDLHADLARARRKRFRRKRYARRVRLLDRNRRVLHSRSAANFHVKQTAARDFRHDHRARRK